MTVKELIEKLQEFPQDEEIFHDNGEGVHISVDEVKRDGMHVITIF